MTNKTINRSHNYSFNVFWSEEDEAYIAVCPEFPGLSAFGETAEQALAEIEVALDMAIETYQEEGWTLPEPTAYGTQQPSFKIPVATMPIAAGSPIPIVGDASIGSGNEDVIEVTRDFLGRHAANAHRLYALRVKGSSMIDVLISDGDIVILEARDTALNGQTVAVWLKREQEATLKRYYLENGRIRLQPANSSMQPIYTDVDNIEIRGRVIGVVRRLE
jgi:SOS-response transcriptional repressor LexA